MGWRVVGAALAAVVAASGWPLQLAQVGQAAELPTVSVTPAPPTAEVEEADSEELDSPAPTSLGDMSQEVTVDVGLLHLRRWRGRGDRNGGQLRCLPHL
ncbi:hypothetical protein EII12_10195, partial [Buchananella hordeovulneris]|uniref:hypothetical protein n=1 Tax=Buchananella hordeovulneris TaxID=52770 RepID=UPI000FBC4419